MDKIIVSASLLICLACGGGGGSSISVNGNLAGQPMSAQDVVSNVLTVAGQSAGVIFITNIQGTCSKLQAQQQPKNSKIIVIELGTQSATTITAPTTGVHTVYSSAAIGTATGQVAIALYSATDAVCAEVTELEATGGTITLTRADGDGYAGNFDITFSDASHVTGSFGANKCAALGAGGQSVCV